VQIGIRKILSNAAYQLGRGDGTAQHGRSLISMIACSGCLFFDINVSQGSAAMRSRRGGIFNYCFSRNLLLSLW